MFREDSYLRDPFSNVTADVHKYVAGSVRIEIRGCARFAGAAPPSGPPTDARTHARTNRWKDRCAANESKSKERVSRMIWLASGGKTVGNFARGGRGGIVFDRNHVLHRDSSFGVPELLSPARSIRGEENRHRGEGGFSFVPGSPLAGSDDSNRNGRKRSNQRVPRFAGMRIYIYIRSVFLRFFILASVSYRILFAFFIRLKGKELSNRVPLLRFSYFFKIYSSFLSFSISSIFKSLRKC